MIVGKLPPTLFKKSFHKSINPDLLKLGSLCLIMLLLAIKVKAQNLSEIYKKVNPAVVVILTEEKKVVSTGITTKTVTAGGLGSGFLVSNKQVVTVAHVVQVAERVRVQFRDGEEIPAKVIASYKSADVALSSLYGRRKIP